MGMGDGDGLRRRFAAQLGLVTRSQARALGLSDSAIKRRVASRDWLRVRPGVFRLATAPESWWTRALAVGLWVAPGGALSHLTAAWLHRIDVNVRAAPRQLEAVVPRTSARTGQVDVRIHSPRKLEAHELGTWRTVRVTSPARTLVDLAGVLGEEALEVAFDSAVRERPGLLPRLEWCLQQGRLQYGKGVERLRELVRSRGRHGATGSGLEVKVWRRLRREGLRPPALQFDVFNQGRHVARVDFAWPLQRVAVQPVGYSAHGGGAQWRRDTAQVSELSLLGWKVLYVTARDLRSDDWLDGVRRGLTLGSDGREDWQGLAALERAGDAQFSLL